MRVENTIYIAASPDVVWAVTKDVERWPEWTPTVTSVKRANADGPFGLGSVVRIKQPAQPESDWTVTEFEPGHGFAWMTRRIGLRMTGIHELSAAGGGTENVLSVMAEGIVALLLWPLLRPAIRRALSAENRGLKDGARKLPAPVHEPDAQHQGCARRPVRRGIRQRADAGHSDGCRGVQGRSPPQCLRVSIGLRASVQFTRFHPAHTLRLALSDRCRRRRLPGSE